MPRVSVIVPAYNASSWICTALRSVLASSFRDFELIVIDDGSTDATTEFVDGLDSRLRLIRQSNAGVSAARNAGMAASDSEFVALLDSDDVWHPRKLELQLRVYAQNPRYGMVYTGFSPWDGESPIDWSEFAVDDRLAPNLTGWIYHKLIFTNWALPSTWLLRRTVIDDVGIFDTTMSMGEDWDYIVRISRGYEMARLASKLVLYRLSDLQVTKKLTLRNEIVDMRQRFLSMYGNTGPDGSVVDEVELTRRQRNAHYGCGLEHIARGSIGFGFRELKNSALYGYKGRMPYDVVKSLVRRAFRRSSSHGN